MNFYLTCILASLVISLLVLAVLVALGTVVYYGYLRANADGHPLEVWASAMVATFGDVWVFALAVFGALVGIVSPLWAVFRNFVSKHLAGLLGTNIVVSAAAFGLVLAGICLAVRGVFWWGDLASGVAGQVLFFLVSGLLAGLVWGTVFWIRTPKLVRTELPV